MIVTKSDFSRWVDMPTNIPDAKVNPHIENIEVAIIRPQLGDALFVALRDISDENPANWASGTAYTVGQFSIRTVSTAKKIYEALSSTTGNTPESSPLYWEENVLGSFWVEYVKPWAALEAFRVFLLLHGKNVSQYGIRVMSEETSTPVDSVNVDYMRRYIENLAATYKARVFRYLDQNDWTIDGTLYEVDCDYYEKERRNTAGIRAIGKGKSLKNGI